MRRNCNLNGKQCFPTRGAAMRAARNMEHRFKGLPSVYHCKACDSWHLTHYSYRFCHDFTHQSTTKPKRDMRIFIDTQDEDAAIMVDTYQPPEQPHRGIMLAFTKEPSPIAIGLSYDQALELIEALKIQIARI